MGLEVPKMLDLPPKLTPLITRFNEFRYFLLEGGRGSAKTQSVARFLLFLADSYSLRIVCGREVQNSIEESVYTVFCDLINENELLFDIKKNGITSYTTKSTIKFMGLREQGAVKIKGLEGVDIFWGEEAQSFSKTSMDILIPTIRKQKSKLIFTMNRFIRKDPVFALTSRKDCLHININYYDNPHCPAVLINEAEECKTKNEKDYKHIWLGQPLDKTTDYLFDFDKLDKLTTLEHFGDLIHRQSVMSVDFASGGGDLCVATLLKRTSNIHWKVADQIAWDNPDTDISVGKVTYMYGQWRPDILIVDAGGLGYPMFVSLSKTIRNIIGFDGGKNDKVKLPTVLNNRAQGYLDVKEFVDNEWLRSDSVYTNQELETIKKTYQKNGKIFMQSKKEAKEKDGVESPDRADSLMMGIFAIVHYLGKVDFSQQDDPIGMRSMRKSGRKRI